MEIIFLIGRVLFGALFVVSGWSHFKHNTQMALYAQGKGVPMPRIVVMLTGLMIVLGGTGIIFGIYVRLSILLLSLFLLGTLIKIHVFWKEGDSGTKAMEKTQFLKNAALLGALLMFLSVLEPWGLSL